MATWKFDEDTCRFASAERSEIDADPDGFYVTRHADGTLVVRAGGADAEPFPSDDRLLVAGVEFSSEDFPNWAAFRQVVGG